MATVERNKPIHRERLSTQICRVAAAMEVLYRLDEATAEQVHEIVNAVIPKPVHYRTVLRDLESLRVIGLTEKRKIHRKYANAYWLWSLATPVELLERLEIQRRRREERDAKN